MNRQLEEKLVGETRLEDIPEAYRPLAEMIGIENLMKLAHYCMGNEIYIPKPETIFRKARNRNIKEEYDGYNEAELAQKYDLSPDSVRKILKGFDPRQISLFDFMKK